MFRRPGRRRRRRLTAARRRGGRPGPGGRRTGRATRCAAWAGPTLVAAIELVSPGNKDRPEARRLFAAKCANYLSQGVGLIAVDVVTGRTADLHNVMMALIGQGDPYLFRADATVYAAAYRPNRPPEGDRVELWPVPLAVDQPLPLLPLALRGTGCVPVDLEASYMGARRRSRLELS